MSHTVTVKLIADQYIEIKDKEVNIHDIKTIVVNSKGQIEKVYMKGEVRSDRKPERYRP